MNVRHRGFTLVELMVAVAVMGIVITVGVVSLNKFGSTQKIEEARDGLISSLRLARNYAVTGQNNSTESLKYVTFTVDGEGNVKAYPNDLVANTYLDKDISPVGTVITASTLRFASYDGKLVDSDGRSVDNEVDLIISTGSEMEDPGGSGITVKISSSGLINE